MTQEITDALHPVVHAIHAGVGESQFMMADETRLAFSVQVGQHLIDAGWRNDPPTGCGTDCEWEALLENQKTFSLDTFGPYPRAAGVIDHIRKELDEVTESDAPETEWVDVLLLAFDGMMGAGVDPHQVLERLQSKLEANMARDWPDWRTADRSKAIEHDRSGESDG